jgi:hypothetical protein
MDDPPDTTETVAATGTVAAGPEGGGAPDDDATATVRLWAGDARELLASEGLYSRLCHLQSELSKITAW